MSEHDSTIDLDSRLVCLVSGDISNLFSQLGFEQHQERQPGGDHEQYNCPLK